jgi:hypothetical protein
VAVHNVDELQELIWPLKRRCISIDVNVQCRAGKFIVVVIIFRYAFIHHAAEAFDVTGFEAAHCSPANVFTLLLEPRIQPQSDQSNALNVARFVPKLAHPGIPSKTECYAAVLPTGRFPLLACNDFEPPIGNVTPHFSVHVRRGATKDLAEALVFEDALHLLAQYESLTFAVFLQRPPRPKKGQVTSVEEGA